MAASLFCLYNRGGAKHQQVDVVEVAFSKKIQISQISGKIKLDDPILKDSRLNFEMALIERGTSSTL